MIRVVALVLLGGCAVTARITPAVVFDPQGKTGVQVVASIGMSIYNTDNDRGGGSVPAFETGFAFGGTGGHGTEETGALVEEYFDYFTMPHHHDDGFAARLGGRLGIRPTVIGSLRALGDVGAAAALMVRVVVDHASSSPNMHFFGVEGRCDEVDAFQGNPRWQTLCAIGPQYEIMLPLRAD